MERQCIHVHTCTAPHCKCYLIERRSVTLTCSSGWCAFVWAPIQGCHNAAAGRVHVQVSVWISSYFDWISGLCGNR